MAFLEKRWVIALGVLTILICYNCLSGWLDSRQEQILTEQSATAESVQSQESASAAEDTKPATVTVYICGAVAKPGVFTLPEGSRVKDAVDMAEGLTPKADALSVNLAEIVTDGQQIVIYEQGAEANSAGAVSAARSKSAGGAGVGLPVSINHGSMEALMLLDGIGEKTAQKIMDYRKAQGGFKNLEELKNVPGIGDKKYDQIKNDIKL